jgi:ABC-type sugar transport system permease subunit
LGQQQTAAWAVLLTKVWKELPFVAIMLLAGLQTIPYELYEAARVDGASLWARFRHVTAPFLMPVVQVALVLETMWTFRIFDIVYVMTGGGPADATNVISFFAYRSTFQYLDLGMGAAASYLVTLAVVGGTVVYLRLIQADLQL